MQAADSEAIPLPFARFVLHEGITAFAADVLIWNRKTYFHKPLLCAGDGPIYQVRRWFRQFYNSHSLQLPAVPARGYEHADSWEQAIDAAAANDSTATATTTTTAATHKQQPSDSDVAGVDRKAAEPVAVSA